MYDDSGSAPAKVGYTAIVDLVSEIERRAGPHYSTRWNAMQA